MSQLNYTQARPPKQLRTAPIPTLAPTPSRTPARGEPDLTGYPWSGLFRCLVATYVLNLPDLRRLVLDQIEHNALTEWGQR